MNWIASSQALAMTKPLSIVRHCEDLSEAIQKEDILMRLLWNIIKHKRLNRKKLYLCSVMLLDLRK